jgi:hypothetical protein
MAIKQANILLEIKRYPSKKDAGQSGSVLRVMQWVFEGNKQAITLEKRGYYTKDGIMRQGKAAGLNIKDMEALQPIWKTVVLMMKNPPAIPAQPKGRKMAEEPLEEVPF